MLVPQPALGVQQRSVFRQVFAVHYEVLPVHVDLQARDIHAQAAHAVDGIEAGRDVAHQNIHGWFAVLVLQEDRHALRCRVRHHFAHTVDKPLPGQRVVALEVVVVALRAGPDNEARPQDSRQVDAALERFDAPAPQIRIGIDERSQLIGRVRVQPRRQAINIHRPQGSFDRLNAIFVDLARIVILQPVHQIGQPIHHALRARHHILVARFWMVANRHKSSGIGAKRPDAHAVLYRHMKCSPSSL